MQLTTAKAADIFQDTLSTNANDVPASEVYKMILLTRNKMRTLSGLQ
jgi:hypothetical protein